MAAILNNIVDGYYVLFDKWGDPRSKELPLMDSPWPGLIILALYLRFVNVWGPNFMKDRKPFNLDRIIIVYNALNVAVSAYLVYRAWDLAWGDDYSYACQPVDFSNHPKAVAIQRCCYVYFWVKIIELLDTVFFILRKKFNQASFLHIYHHTGMVMLAWGGVKYLPGGHGTFLGWINSFVHIVMYSYYLVTAVWPQAKNNLWWKKHITQLQMIQFAMIIIHAMQLLFRESCGYPKWTVIVVVPQNLFMFLLFFDFYRKAYRTQPPQSDKKSVAINGDSKAMNGSSKVTNGTSKAVNGNGKLTNGINSSPRARYVGGIKQS